jgi:hypothetical protein
VSAKLTQAASTLPELTTVLTHVNISCVASVPVHIACLLITLFNDIFQRCGLHNYIIYITRSVVDCIRHSNTCGHLMYMCGLLKCTCCIDCIGI